MAKKAVKDILDKYERKLSEKFGDTVFDEPGKNIVSVEYNTFRREVLEKNITNYERWCKFAAGILNVSPPEKDREQLEKNIAMAHLNVTPEAAASFGAVCGIGLILLGIVIGAISFVVGSVLLFIPLALIISGAVIIKPLSKLPNYLAERWRLEASNQMVLCILYIVMYMRHTSNLEHAIKFAAEHIGPPLSLDFKKILWDVETGKFFSIKESIDHYLTQWRDHNIVFVESFHLIEGSLYEPSEQRRVEILEKSLDVILEGIYNRMLTYTHDLKSPITVLHMLGVILPILGLVIFPLVGSFLGGAVKWFHLLILYNIFLPIVVFALGVNILRKRPPGYGESELLRSHPEFNVLKQWIVRDKVMPFSPVTVGVLISVAFVLVGLLPVLLFYVAPGWDFPFLGGMFLDYKGANGPYGAGALFLSMLIPLGIALGVSFYYKVTTKRLIAIKKEVDNLEEEFSGAIFQMGTRIGDGIPPEMAFGEVASSMSGTPTGKFFSTVDRNIRKLGYGLKRAIFDPRVGAVILYPSHLIESTMKALIETSRKGPAVVSASLMTISNYSKKIKHVNERLKDLLADILSSMTSQISFLTPMIAGIVVGVGSMVTTIINKLSEQFAAVGSAEGLGNVGAIANIFRIEDVIPSYYFQIIVGLYVVQITIILTILSTSIERGVDRTTTRYRIGRNVIRAMGLYFVIALIGIIVFTFLANAVGVVSTVTGGGL